MDWFISRRVTYFYLINLQKLRVIELPTTLIYRISKKSKCFGGLAINYFVDNKTSLASYKAEGIKTLGGRSMQPGMPVQVVIKTGERSLLTYLMHPLTKRMAASMKEE
jgi:hypothetical protein